MCVYCVYLLCIYRHAYTIYFENISIKFHVYIHIHIIEHEHNASSIPWRQMSLRELNVSGCFSLWEISNMMINGLCKGARNELLKTWYNSPTGNLYTGVLIHVPVLKKFHKELNANTECQNIIKALQPLLSMMYCLASACQNSTHVCLKYV